MKNQLGDKTVESRGETYEKSKLIKTWSRINGTKC